jgi:hypothetical protein
MQDNQAQRKSNGHLRKPQTQAAPGLTGAIHLTEVQTDKWLVYQVLIYQEIKELKQV